MKRMLFSLSANAFLILYWCCQPTFARQGQSERNPTANDQVREVVRNELDKRKEDHTHWMYRLETEKAGAKDVVEVVETKQGDLTRLISRNGQRLTDQQRAEEDRRTEKFVNDPEEQRKRQQDESDDEHKTKELLELLPDALNFSYVEHNGNTATLNFQPNPSFHPPTREAHAFHEMEGRLIIDEKQRRLLEIHGRLRNAVHFGIFGHLDPGGTFDVQQQEVAPNHWEITLLKINMKGKALFYRTINVQQNEQRNRFQQVPDDLTFSRARDMLQTAKVQ